jgi:hypothetical protein
MEHKYRKAIALAVSMAVLLPLSTVNLTQSNDKLLIASASDSTDLTGKCGDNATWSYNSNTNTLTVSGTGAIYDYDEPYFDQSWFAEAGGTDSEVKSIVVEEGITSIGAWAFAPFSLVKSVKLPSTLTAIGDYAFQIYNNDFDVLTEITIPSSVTKIGTHAVGYYFTTYQSEDNDVYEKTDVIDGFTIKGYNGQAETYANANGITFVSLKDENNNDNSEDDSTLTGKCGENATWSYDEITGALTISGTGAMYDYSIENRPPYACMGVEVTKIVIEEGITSIGDYAFHVNGYGGLESLYTVESISLPSTLKKVGNYAFSGFLDNLKSVKAPNGVDELTEIGEGAFLKWADVSHPNDVKDLTIPASVKVIGDHALGYIGGDGGTYMLQDGFIIRGYKGSQAETYANANGITFIALDEPDKTVTTTTDPGKTVTTTTTKTGTSSPPTSDKGVTPLLLASVVLGATAVLTSKRNR